MKKHFKYYIMLFLFTLTINVISVDASGYSEIGGAANSGMYDSPDANKYSPDLYNECVDKKTCLLLCAYENKISNIEYASAYIYYNFDGQLQIDWYGSAREQGKDYNSKKNSFKNIFIESEVKKNLTSKGVCPNYLFVDTDDFNGANEICFDNDNKYCKTDPGKSFTKFEGKSEKKYDYITQVDIYYQNYAPNIPSCEDLRSKNFDIKKQLLTDFKANFLYGKDVPKFILKNDNYIKFNEELEQKYIEFTNSCNKEIDNKVDSGEISSNEAEKLKEQNQSGLDNALNQLENALTEIRDDIGDIEPGDIIPNSCKVIPPIIRKWINNILNFVRYVALALVIALGALDFMKAAGTGEPDSFKKAGQSFLKRMIAVVILFLLPYIVDLILNLVDLYGVDLKDPTCTNISQ